jgi:hypothetical protein
VYNYSITLTEDDIIMKASQQSKCIIQDDGTHEWFLNGKLHRTDGPARIYTNGTQAWCIHRKKHRTDGPALIWADGRKTWWLNDQPYFFNDWLDAIPASDQERTFLMLKYGVI